MSGSRTKGNTIPKKFNSRKWVNSLEREVHSLINKERRTRNVRTLILGKYLSTIAKGHSEDMCKNHFFSHTNKKGLSPSGRANLANYNCPEGLHVGIGENICQEYVFCGIKETKSGNTKSYYSRADLAKTLVMIWMHSPGHKENILNAGYNRHGIGVSISSNGKVYATSNFC